MCNNAADELLTNNESIELNSNLFRFLALANVARKIGGGSFCYAGSYVCMYAVYSSTRPLVSLNQSVIDVNYLTIKTL